MVKTADTGVTDKLAPVSPKRLEVNMIDINRPLKAKVYDFDTSWNNADGEDSKGKYIIRAVEMITFPHLPYVKYSMIHCQGGTLSETFELLPQE